MAKRVADAQGWFRMTGYVGGTTKGSKYSFYRNTTNENLTFWVKPGETTNDYIVVRSKQNEEGEFEDKTVGQFPTATEAKEWANQEFAHLFS